jgi:hypothetical protein
MKEPDVRTYDVTVDFGGFTACRWSEERSAG